LNGLFFVGFFVAFFAFFVEGRKMMLFWRIILLMKKISRRQFAKELGVASMGGLFLGKISFQQQREPENLESELARLEAKLAEPLSEEAWKLTKEALQSNLRAYASRWRFKLPENSEPCTIFVPQPAKKVKP